jgi:hypothetical protein
MCIVVVITCFVMCGCVCAGFLLCGCFDNMCTCIYCVLYWLLCFLLFHLCTFSLTCLVCSSVRTATPSQKLIAVNNNNNNNNNNNVHSRFQFHNYIISISLFRFSDMRPILHNHIPRGSPQFIPELLRHNSGFVPGQFKTSDTVQPGQLIHSQLVPHSAPGDAANRSAD